MSVQLTKPVAELYTTTGISVSKLSRLEYWQRKPTLELLLPLFRSSYTARPHGASTVQAVATPLTLVSPNFCASPF